ncbi:MAG: glycosyltransferase family 2 protein [Xanthobacteraceae bacterium]|nr:glycosyltransferase family 2 protein [Xanthobacteraceae bacterium]
MSDVIPTLTEQDVPLTGQAVTLRTSFRRVDARTFAGYVVCESELNQRHVVELLIDGVPIDVTQAAEYDQALAGVGDGCYGFSFALLENALSDNSIIEARLANARTPVGQPIQINRDDQVQSAEQRKGDVTWLGGLRFTGWVERPEMSAAYVNALVDGELVAQAHNWRWHHIGKSREDARVAPAFDLHLPRRFADGRVRRVRFVDETGTDLPGSPVACVAFDQGLGEAIARLGLIETEQLRGELFDLLVPSSYPLSDYRRWAQRFPHPPVPTQKIPQTVAVVFIGDADPEPSAQSLELQTEYPWTAVALPPVRDSLDFDPAALREFLEGEAAACDVVIFALAGMTFQPGAIATLVAAFSQREQAALVYADLLLPGDREHHWLLAFPAFDYERMLEQGYGAYLFAARRSGVDRALDAASTNPFRVFNAIANGPQAAGSVVHVPQALAVLPVLDRTSAASALAQASAEHLTARGVAVQIRPSSGETFPAVRVSRQVERSTVSLIIPTRNRLELLRRCLQTIAPACSRRGAEIIVVDNDSSEPAMLDFLAATDGRSARVLRVPGPFNFARLNNIAVQAARGEFVCLLNNDIEANDDVWLDEMLSRCSEPDVGAVGALLAWPSGVVQHGGVVLGSNLAASHAFKDRVLDDPGYTDLLRVAHECSAVTAACMLTRRADYEQVGGFDEINFPINFNDVDYCLKLRALGKRIVFTPHSALLHLESASRGQDRGTDRAARFERELRILRARWLHVLIEDPFYSPLLSLDSIPFSALAWPPRSFAPRTVERPVPVLIPPGM